METKTGHAHQKAHARSSKEIERKTHLKLPYTIRKIEITMVSNLELSANE